MKNWINSVIKDNEFIKQQTLKYHKQTLKKINLHVRMLDELFNTLHKDPDLIDPSYDILIYCNIEIEASCFLALNGYYEDAVALLRIIIDTSLKKIHSETFPIIEENYYEVLENLVKKRDLKKEKGEWSKKDEKLFKVNLKILQPSFRNTLDSLFSWVVVKKFERLRQSRPSFKKEIEDFYNLTCAHIHPSKDRVLFKNKIRTSAKYSKNLFEFWSNLFFHMCKILAIILFFVYEEIFDIKKNPSITFKKLYTKDFEYIKQSINYYLEERDKPLQSKDEIKKQLKVAWEGVRSGYIK